MKTVCVLSLYSFLTYYVAYRRVITNESLIKGIQKVYTPDIATHAMVEIEKAAERFNASSTENAGLVYDVKLFESLIINGRFISDPKSLPAEVSVMLSAALEYFTAEVLEITSTTIFSIPVNNYLF